MKEPTKEIDYSALPHHMRLGARLYLEDGISPGSFLHIVLANDLVGAWGAADEDNRAALSTWAEWLHNECPKSAWGSYAVVRRWIANRRP